MLLQSDRQRRRVDLRLARIIDQVGPRTLRRPGRVYHSLFRAVLCRGW